MRTDATRPTSRGLSCYTENLAGCLAARAPARASLTARSVRLAGNPATGCFSHHDRALNNLPGGRRLAYRGAPTPRRPSPASPPNWPATAGCWWSPTAARCPGCPVRRTPTLPT